MEIKLDMNTQIDFSQIIKSSIKQAFDSEIKAIKEEYYQLKDVMLGKHIGEIRNLKFFYLNMTLNKNETINSEEYARDYIKKVWGINFCEKFCNINVDKNNPLIPEFIYNIIHDCPKHLYGRPDFLCSLYDINLNHEKQHNYPIVYKSNPYINPLLHNYFCVEVKCNEDGLKFSQLKWIVEHPDIIVIIFFIQVQKGESTDFNTYNYTLGHKELPTESYEEEIQFPKIE